jgi:hypothetical protein
VATPATGTHTGKRGSRKITEFVQRNQAENHAQGQTTATEEFWDFPGFLAKS